MDMNIHLFTFIRDNDYSMSCNFNLANLVFTEKHAFGVLQFGLKTPDGLQWRKVAVNFDKEGFDYTRKLCVDTHEYASIVDKTPEFKAVEKELCDSVCLIIGRIVRKHFAKGE